MSPGTTTAYALILVTYTLWNGLSSPPAVTSLGRFDDETKCNQALPKAPTPPDLRKAAEPAAKKRGRDQANPTDKDEKPSKVAGKVNELRWILLCMPTTWTAVP